MHPHPLGPGKPGAETFQMTMIWPAAQLPGHEDEASDVAGPSAATSDDEGESACASVAADAPASHRAAPRKQSSHDQRPSVHEQMYPSVREQFGMGLIGIEHWVGPEHGRPVGSASSPQPAATLLQPVASGAGAHVLRLFSGQREA
jgi:hypothetical protein